MADHFADRLSQVILSKGTCLTVGVDPVYNKLPKQIIDRKDLNDGNDLPAALDALFEFSTRVLKIVAPLVPAVKINSGFFERYLWEGVEYYYSLIQEAEAMDLEVIGDVKRGDIGSTAEAYADGHIKNCDFMDMDYLLAPDAITVNGFCGVDGIKPFADRAAEGGKGIFVWVRASNPSAAVLQDFADAEGRRFFDVLADQVAELAGQKDYMSANGQSCIGMVVGGTASEQAAVLRERYPHVNFLVPGYGAQGATVEDCISFCRKVGDGALISASRSIIYAYQDPKYIEQFGDDWEKCIEQACLDAKMAISDALGSIKW